MKKEFFVALPDEIAKLDFVAKRCKFYDLKILNEEKVTLNFPLHDVLVLNFMTRVLMLLRLPIFSVKPVRSSPLRFTRNTSLAMTSVLGKWIS